jgi:hypothetical protein
MTAGEHNDVDRLVMTVAGALTAADASGLGDRVRARLDAPRRTWLAWAPLAAGAAAIVIIAANRPGDVPLPHVPALVQSGALPAPAPATAVAAMAASLSDAPGRTRQPRASRPETAGVADADAEWLARTIPALPAIEPPRVDALGLNPIELPVLDVTPLPSPDDGGK